MLTQGENGNDIMQELKTGLLMDFSRQIVARFAYPVITPLLVPAIYRWADALSSGYQRVYPGINKFQWSQDLISRLWGVQLLTCVTPYQWLPLDYSTWFTPEWRHLIGWLPGERWQADMMEGGSGDQTRREFYREYDVPENGIAGDRLPLASTVLPNSALVRQNNLLRHRDYPQNAFNVEDAPPIYHPEQGEGFHILHSLPLHDTQDSGSPLRIMATFTEAMEPISWLQKVNQSESIIARWQPRPRVFLPITLRGGQLTGNIINRETPLEDVWRVVEEGRQIGFESPHSEKSLAWQQGVFDMPSRLLMGLLRPLRSTQSFGSHAPCNDMEYAGDLVNLARFQPLVIKSGDVSPSLNQLSPGGIPELWLKDKEIVDDFSQSGALTLMSPNLRHWLSEAEQEEMVLSPLSQPGKSTFPRISAKVNALGIMGMEPVTITSQAPLAKYAHLEEIPLGSNSGSYYAQPLSLLLMPQVSIGSGEGYPVDASASANRESHSWFGRGSAEKSSARLGNSASEVTVPNLAPLARPQGGGNPAPSPTGEGSASFGEEQAEDEMGVDTEALAREVYDIIKHRLLVEKEQALGMV